MICVNFSLFSNMAQLQIKKKLELFLLCSAKKVTVFTVGSPNSSQKVSGYPGGQRMADTNNISLMFDY